jgi:hypothetical protein
MNAMMKLAAMIVVANVIVWFLFVANQSTSDQLQHTQQEALLRAADAAIGMPVLVNFEERKMLKRILEIRDHVINTTTYIVDMNGHPHKICDSIGYGFPLSTQFTNPAQNPRATVVISQAEPNGLFSSPTSEGTWISCVDPANKHNIQVVYVEPRVIVSPFPLSASSDLRLENAGPIGVQVNRAAALRGGDGDFRIDQPE